MNMFDSAEQMASLAHRPLLAALYLAPNALYRTDRCLVQIQGTVIELRTLETAQRPVEDRDNGDLIISDG